MNTIVFGRGSSSCSDAKSADRVDMCNIFPSITAANVKIVYARTELSSAGRPGGQWFHWAAGSTILTMLLHGLVNFEGMLETFMTFHD